METLYPQFKQRYSKAYGSHRKRLEKALTESRGDWLKLYCEEVYTDSDLTAEVFIDMIEESISKRLKDDKELARILGVEETSEELAFMNRLINQARANKYVDKLTYLIDFQATYPELLETNPKDFGLAESWTGLWGETQNKETAIDLAIACAFKLFELSMDRPALRDIAQKLQAPRGVIMRVHEKYKF